MNNLEYFYIVDCSTQWFRAVVSVLEIGDKRSYYHLHEFFELTKDHDNGEVFSNIYNRKLHFQSTTIIGAPNHLSWCYGWSISEREFRTIRRIVELAPSVEEYKHLQKNLI